MQRLVHTVALLAALVALILAIVRDSGVLVAVKRAFVSYLAFFLLTAILALIFRVGVLAEGRSADQERKSAANSEPTP